MDDSAPRPLAPGWSFDDLPENPDELLHEQKLAQASFHPAWDGVVAIITENIESFAQPVNSELPAEEYKIKSVANQEVVRVLNGLLRKVEDAVKAVESAPAPRKRKGGK